MADVTGFENWSTTAASNAPSGSTAIGSGLDDNLREIQAQVREWLATADTIASDSTTDLSTKGARFITVSGTTTITSFGTLSAGIEKVLIFSDALTLTHNGTSLILPTAANITTAAGDIASFVSLGSGNWRCTGYLRATGRALDAALSLSDGSVSAPPLYFTNDTDTGLYRSASPAFVGLVWSGSSSPTVLKVDADGVTSTKKLTATTELVAATANIGTDDLVVSSTAGVSIAPTKSLTNTGAVVIASGDAYAGGVAGASVTIEAGAGSTTGEGGSISILAGGWESGDEAGNGGDISIIAGSPGSSSSYQGGSITIQAGSGNTSAESGDIWITSSANAAAMDNTKGNINIYTTDDEDDNIGIKCWQRPAIVAFTGKTPSIVSSSAGTGGSIAGNMNVMKVTFGTSANTTLTISLNGSSGVIENPPVVHCTYEGATNIVCHVASVTDTQIQIKFASTPVNGDKVNITAHYYD